MNLDGIDVRWCDSLDMAEGVAQFFADHADVSYISHSELQTGRALAPGQWSPGLEVLVAEEARRAVATTIADADSGTRLAVATLAGKLGAVAFVTLVPDASTRFAVLEDLLVAPAMRGAGLGTGMLAWVRDQCRTRGVRRLFLESGVGNHRAHHFFEQHGFKQTSIVMVSDV